METFDVASISDKEIVLNNAKDLERVYALIQSGDDNFIIRITTAKEIKSQVIISSTLSAKLKTGELLLTSKEVTL